MAGVLVGNAAGFQYCQLFMLNGSNYAVGNSASGATPANGSTVHALKLDGGVTNSLNPRGTAIVEFRSNDRISGKIGFGSRDMQELTIDFEEVDLSAVALMSGSSVDATTNTEWKIASLNPQKINIPNCGLILTQFFQSRESATSGQNKYWNHVLPIGTAVMRPGGLTYQDKSTWQLSFTPTMGTKFPWGEAFGANQGWEDNETDYYIVSGDNPLALTTFVGNGTATSFVAGYRPVSTGVTVNATKNYFAQNGTPDALSSVVTTTGVMTIDGTPAAGVVGVAAYETNFQAI